MVRYDHLLAAHRFAIENNRGDQIRSRSLDVAVGRQGNDIQNQRIAVCLDSQGGGIVIGYFDLVVREKLSRLDHNEAELAIPLRAYPHKGELLGVD